MNKNVFVSAFEKKLYCYPNTQESLQKINDRLEFIETELLSVGSSNPTSYNNNTGSDFNVVENKRLNLISEQIALSQQLKKVEYEYMEIKKGLSYLNKEEYEIIEMRYFKRWSIEKIENTKYISKSSIYREIEKALIKIVERLRGNIN